MLDPLERDHAYGIALPVALALFGDLLVERLELIEVADELLRRRELLNARKRAGEQRLVLIGELRVDPIELFDGRLGERALRGFGHRPGDPAVLLALGRNSPRALGGKHLLAVKLHAAILEERRLPKLLPEIGGLLHELDALGLELAQLLVELRNARFGEVVDDPGNRLLELLGAVLVAVDHAHTKRPQARGDMLLDDPQRLRGVASHQDSLPSRKQMPDAVGDGVRLAGPRRALDHDGVLRFQLLDDSALLRIGVFREQEIDRAGRGWVLSSLLARAFLLADQAQQRL